MDSRKSHNNKNKLTDRSSGRTSITVLCDVKIPLLSREFGDFGESDIAASVSHGQNCLT